MLRHVGQLFTATLALIAAKSLKASEDEKFAEFECKITDIGTRIKAASQLIETARNLLPDDFKKLFENETCGDKPLNCTECGKCSYLRKPVDCSDVYDVGNHTDGVYEIWPQNRIVTGAIFVYCDMTTEGGGWTVFQRRGNFGNPESYFYQDWNAYKTGFGDLEKEFWLGNDNIFALSNQRHYELRVDLEAWNSDTQYAKYHEFWIDDEKRNYALHIGQYMGTAGDSLSYHNGCQFSTKDRDNDNDPSTSGSCAELHEGAWWYNTCLESNLNGPYFTGYKQHRGGGIIWTSFKGSLYSLEKTAMKIRPFEFGRRP